MSRTPHILIVDDDREIRDLVGKVLERDGFRISRAENEAAMRRVLADGAIDLIVLDIMLPGKDGLALCRELRGSHDPTPIIMLTAKGDDIDRILGLEMGADDYLPKPFNSRELVARIKAVLRRGGSGPKSEPTCQERFYCFEGWRLDIGKRELLSPECVIVSLSSSEYGLLLELVQRPQRTLTRDQLIDLTRGRAAAVFDRSIDIQISRLRKKLGDDPKDPRMIKTVWGGGYLFAPDVTTE
ncbi:response regulator [Leisingera sp. ANG59]|uniref:response regulator n=1 Tax=Leisingera sp. ANG59 TaxID=2675221 RepID=UPI001573E4C3|nr:response regulator [Leisingera sp. ANG59]NSY41406.1 response regulator [Leisingera sp. ANG59]